MNGMGTGIWLKQSRAAVTNLVVLLSGREACWLTPAGGERMLQRDHKQFFFFFFKCLYSAAVSLWKEAHSPWMAIAAFVRLSPLLQFLGTDNCTVYRFFPSFQIPLILPQCQLLHGQLTGFR